MYIDIITSLFWCSRVHNKFMDSFCFPRKIYTNILNLSSITDDILMYRFAGRITRPENDWKRIRMNNLGSCETAGLFRRQSDVILELIEQLFVLSSRKFVLLLQKKVSAIAHTDIRRRICILCSEWDHYLVINVFGKKSLSFRRLLNRFAFSTIILYNFLHFYSC